MFRSLMCCNSVEEAIEIKRKETLTDVMYIPDTKTTQTNCFDESRFDNVIFPWLTEKYVSLSRHREFDQVDSGKLCRAKSFYQFIAQFKSTEFCQLYYAIMKEVDVFCNVKVYKFSGVNEYKVALTEALVLDIVRGSPFIVQPIEYFKTMGGHYLVTESYGTVTLHNLLIDKNFFTDVEIRFFAAELVTVLQYLHSKGVIHRSLCGNCVGVTPAGHIKLFDLENTYFELGQDGSSKMDCETMGTVGLESYMAPEMVSYTMYTNKVDWWSLGVLLYMLMHGKMPFRGRGRRGLMVAIREREPVFDSGVHNDACVDLVRKLLDKDPLSRLGDSEVRGQAFFKDTDWDKVEALGYEPPFPYQPHPVTNMPAEICCSHEFLPNTDSMTEVIEQTSKSSKRNARIRSLQPLRHYDYQLDPNWTSFITPPGDVSKGIAFVHNYLQVPEASLPDFIEDCVLVCPVGNISPLLAEGRDFVAFSKSAASTRAYSEESSSSGEYFTPIESDEDYYMRRTSRQSVYRRSVYKGVEDNDVGDDDSFKDIEDDPFLDDDDMSTLDSIDRVTRLGSLVRKLDDRPKKKNERKTQNRKFLHGMDALRF